VIAALTTVIAQGPPPVDQECGTLDLTCEAGKAIESVFTSLATQIAQGAADLVVGATSWWVTTPSVDPQDPAVLAAQGATGYLVSAILAVSVLVQAGRLIITRRAEPLGMIVGGLARFAVVSALGLVLLHGALQAGDALAVELLGGAAGNFGTFMREQLTADPENVFLILLLSVIAAVLGILQWGLMDLRQAGLLVLAAAIPLAASGSLTRTTRGWLNRLMGWLVAIVVYKPAAAFIYFIGFTYLSSPSANTTGRTGTMLTGVMVLALAVVAMPALMKFFSWTGANIGGAGGGSGFLGAAGAVAMSQAYQQSHAVSRASSMQATGPGSQAVRGADGGGATGAAGAGGAPVGSAAGAAGGAAGGAGVSAAAGPWAAAAGAVHGAAQWTGGQMTGAASSADAAGTAAPPAGPAGHVASGAVAPRPPNPGGLGSQS
jgi:type IV secretion system protein TrbL